MIENIKQFFIFGQQFITAHWLLLIVSGFLFLFIEKVGHVVWNIYLHRIRHKWVHNLKWVTFQLKFPKENLKSPKAMEQVIASLHGKYSFGIPWRDEYLNGEVEYWFSLEMVGRSSGISFYARAIDKNAQMFKTAFFAQYPEAEITEVPDYINEFPEELPNETYDVFGTDYKTDRKDEHGHSLDPYPIKTYEFFDSPSDDQRLDPMSTIAEAVSNLKGDETILVQILISPTGIAENHELRKTAEKIKDKIMGREKKKGEKSLVGEILTLLKHTLLAFFHPPQFDEKEEEKKMTFSMYTQGEMDTLKAIDNKLSKNMFNTVFRFVYIDRRDSFTKENPFAFFGAVTQFSDRQMNSFRPQNDTFTMAEKLRWIKNSPKRFNKKQRVERRAGQLYQAYRHRAMPISAHHVSFKEKWVDEFIIRTSVLSSEEIATIYHPPGVPVGAQKLQPIEVKKAKPPATLPIIED